MRKLTSGSFFMMRVAMVYFPTVSVDVESNFTLFYILVNVPARVHYRI